MSQNARTFLYSMIDWSREFGVSVRAALASPILDRKTVAEAGVRADPDFEGWLHNDPMVTGNAASRYGDDAPGYLTGNGLGSLEIGAADD